jgi:hypothetical protein
MEAKCEIQSKPARAQGDVVNIYDERLARRLRKGIGMRWTRVLGSQARKNIRSTYIIRCWLVECGV